MRDLAEDMTHAALTPLLGREFDSFLFASIGDDENGPLLSVVSAFARLDVDPWKEAATLARMPKQLAIGRLTSLLASVPKGSTTGLAPEVIAARLVALLPQAAGLNAAAPAALRQAAPTRHPRMFVGLGVLALLLVAYFIFASRGPGAPGGVTHVPAATSEPSAPR
jgi:hypothetical protein